MANDEIKDIGKYCYNITLDAIRYTDDSAKWSPNNIRRLILSPDGVAVQLHTGKTIIKKPFNREKAYICFSDLNYKPMITALIDRVCSSIEEIVLCTGSNNGLFMPDKEVEFRAVLAKTKVSQTDEALVKNIADRFVRLRGVLIFSCTIVDFLNKYSPIISDHLCQLSDLDSVKNEARILDIHKNDWYKGYYLRKDSYSFDKEGGALYSTLHKVESVIEKNKYDSALAESKDKRLKDSIDKVKASEIKTLRVLRAYKDIASLVKNCHITCIFKDDFSEKTLSNNVLSIVSKYAFFDSEKVLSGDFTSIVIKYGAKIINNNKCDAKEELKNLMDTLDTLFLELYVSLCDNFLDIILMSGRKYPIMTTIKLKQYDRVVYIPPQLIEKSKLADTYFVEPLNGSSIKDSLANICCLITFMLLSDSDEKGSTVKKYYKKQAWLDKYKDLEVSRNE